MLHAHALFCSIFNLFQGILDKVGRVGNSRVVLTEAEGYPALMIPGKSLDNKYRTDRLIVYTEQTTPFGQRYN